MEHYLRRRDLWSEEWARSIMERFNRQLSEAATSVENPADMESQFDNVYSSRPVAASAR
jgi:TPP-dependent pyruvate/acetoin dehydrogenase alpha subunit